MLPVFIKRLEFFTGSFLQSLFKELVFFMQGRRATWLGVVVVAHGDQQRQRSWQCLAILEIQVLKTDVFNEFDNFMCNFFTYQVKILWIKKEKKISTKAN